MQLNHFIVDLIETQISEAQGHIARSLRGLLTASPEPWPLQSSWVPDYMRDSSCEGNEIMKFEKEKMKLCLGLSYILSYSLEEAFKCIASFRRGVLNQ